MPQNTFPTESKYFLNAKERNCFYSNLCVCFFRSRFSLVSHFVCLIVSLRVNVFGRPQIKMPDIQCSVVSTYSSKTIFVLLSMKYISEHRIEMNMSTGCHIQRLPNYRILWMSFYACMYCFFLRNLNRIKRLIGSANAFNWINWEVLLSAGNSFRVGYVFFRLRSGFFQSTKSRIIRFVGNRFVY